MKNFIKITSAIVIVAFIVGPAYLSLAALDDATLIAYYTLDESSDGSGPITRQDSHTGNNDLTDNNGTPSATGKISNGASFTTANSEYLNDGNVFDNPGSFTFSVWVKVTGTSVNQGVFNKIGAAGSAQGLSGIVLSTGDGDYPGSFQMHIQTDGDQYKQRSSGTTRVDDGAFHFIVVDWDGTDTSNTSDGMHIYIDNSVDLGVDHGSSFQIDSLTNALNFELGRNGQGGTIRYFGGIVDEFGMWFNRVLTADERTTLWNNGAGLTYPFSAASEAKPRRVIIFKFEQPINLT